MNESILITIKKLLGLDEDYRAFDMDIIVFVNTAIMALRQIGVGPVEGFSITGDDEKWSDLIGESEKLESVKTYIYLRVRLLFDPPANGTIMEAFKQNLAEYEWRLNVSVDQEDSVI